MGRGAQGGQQSSVSPALRGDVASLSLSGSDLCWPALRCGHCSHAVTRLHTVGDECTTQPPALRLRRTPASQALPAERPATPLLTRVLCPEPARSVGAPPRPRGTARWWPDVPGPVHRGLGRSLQHRASSLRHGRSDHPQGRGGSETSGGDCLSTIRTPTAGEVGKGLVRRVWR